MSLPSAGPPPARLLVRGVNWLGDAVMTTPALQRLRERFPQTRITLIGPAKLQDLWLQHPSLDDALSFSPGESPWRVARRLREQGFDAALVFPNSPRSALEMWLARVPRRVGFARPWRNWFLTHRVAPRPGFVPMRKLSPGEVRRLVNRAGVTHPATGLTSNAHHLHEYLHLVAALGANPEPVPPLLRVTAAELESANRLWRDAAPAATPLSSGFRPLLLGVNPGAAYGPAKCWPTENFAAVMRELARRVPGCVWLIFGGPGDRTLGDELAGNAGGTVLNLAGRTSMRELMALLKLCRVVLANDSGPMHVAAALGTPVVVPFGSTSPELTGPGLPGASGQWLLRGEAQCAPCFLRTCPIDFRCMTTITVPRVVEAVLQATNPP